LRIKEQGMHLTLNEHDDDILNTQSVTKMLAQIQELIPPH